MTTRDRSSSSASDHERLDAIQRYDLVEYGSYYMDHEMKGADEGVWVRYDDVADRLAALEHERDDALNACANAIGEAVERERDLLLHSPVLQAVLDAIKGTIDTSTNIADHPNVKFAQMERLKLEKRAEHAEAALLSLQAAVRELGVEMRAEIQRIGRDYDIHTVPSVWAWTWTNKLAALLPDPAGTQATKTDEDTHARVHGETQAATDRNYRVQQNGDQ